MTADAGRSGWAAVRNRRQLALAAAAVVALAGVTVAVIAGRSSEAVAGSGPTAPATATVERRTLDATTVVDGTLGFGERFHITHSVGSTGVLTWLPEVGSTVAVGQRLYAYNGAIPVVLMAGSVPAWRDLRAGIADGIDVKQLEANLRDLGFGTSRLKVDRHWDARTTAAVKRWQKAAGLRVTGRVERGAVVFEPGPVRVTSPLASLGDQLHAGSPIVDATSTTPVITIALEASLQRLVKADDQVSITLPDGATASGRVSHVSTVATVSGNAADNDGSRPTIAVEVTLDDPSMAGGLDQAPVSVNISADSVADVLAVPVTALVVTLDGQYAVEVVDQGQRRYVPVRLGLFAGGLVEVDGAGLTEGQAVVIAR